MNHGWRVRNSAAPRRILMTADAVGGVWQYCQELAAGLVGAGAEVWLAIMGPAPTQDQLKDAELIRGLRVLHGDFRLEWMEHAEGDVQRAGDWLMMLAHELRPDLVHLNGYAHASLPWRCPVVVTAHSCVTTWWRAVHRCAAPPEWDGYRALVSRGLDAADLVIAPTFSFLRTLHAAYGFVTPSRAIWNGRSSPPRPATDKKRVVMTAGRLWDVAKNVAALTAIAPELGYPVWVAGAQAGPGHPAQDGEDGLVHLGRLSDKAMRARLAEALIFALPARYEPFGLTALEAAHAGCALVLGDIETQRELWDGVALFVPPDDPDALARHLRRLLEDPARAGAMSAVAHRRARRYTAERMVRSYLRAYSTLLKAAPRRTGAVRAAAKPLASLHTL